MRFVYSPVGGSEALRGRVTQALQPAAVVRGAANTPHASPVRRRSSAAEASACTSRTAVLGRRSMRRPPGRASRLRGRPGTACGMKRLPSAVDWALPCEAAESPSG